jgi:hypothetical protein
VGQGNQAERRLSASRYQWPRLPRWSQDWGSYRVAFGTLIFSARSVADSQTAHRVKVPGNWVLRPFFEPLEGVFERRRSYGKTMCRFRSSPNNGRQQIGPVGPFRARRQHSGRQLLDQFVGECEQVWRDRDTKLPCGLEIDHQPELAGLLDRQVAGLYTPNYFGSVDTPARR